MERVKFKPGNMLYPVPPVMVTTKDWGKEANIFTVAWAGTVCSSPPMVSISVRKERYSYAAICHTGEFVINLVTGPLAYAADYCGVRSGRDVDKFAQMHLTAVPAENVEAPLILESPVNIECRVKQQIPLGSHDLFLAEVVAVQVDGTLLDDKNVFHLNQADLVAYSHGAYYSLGKNLGRFGFSVRKKGKAKSTGKNIKNTGA